MPGSKGILPPLSMDATQVQPPRDPFENPDCVLLKRYLSSSPSPIFACPSTLSAKSASLRTFDLTTTYYANAEAERATGGRGLWNCLAIDGKAKLAAGVEAAWKRYLAALRMVESRRLSAADNPMAPISNPMDNYRSSLCTSLPTEPLVDHFDIFQMIYPPSDPSHERRPEMKHMRWTATFIPAQLDVVPSPSPPSPSARETIPAPPHVLVLTGRMTAPVLPPPVMVKPHANHSSSGSSARQSSSSSSMPEESALADGLASLSQHSTSIPKRERTASHDHASSQSSGSPPHVARQLPDPSLSAVSNHDPPWRHSTGSTHSVNSLTGSIPEHVQRSSVVRSPESFSSSHQMQANMSRQWEAELEEEDTVAFARILARVADQAPIGLVRTNADAKIIWTNSTWYRTVGLSPGDDLDKWIENISERHLAHILQVVACQIEKRSASSVEFQWKNGNWSLLSMTTETDEDGEVTALIGVLEDITARKRLEAEKVRGAKEREAGLKKLANAACKEKEEAEARERLQRQLEQKSSEFAHISKASTCGLTSARTDGLLFWANDAFFEIHGLEPGVDPNLWGDKIHPEDLPALVEAWKVARDTLQPLRSQHRLTDGKTVFAQSVPTISQEDGSIVWVGSITDITQQVESEAKIAHMNEEKLEQSKRHADEAEERRRIAVEQRDHTEYLVDMVSHETRNAISPILQSSLLVKKSLLELQRQLLDLALTIDLPEGIKASIDKLEEDFEALDAITDSAHAQERVSNDILGLAQIQLNQLTVNPTPSDLRAMMKSVNRMFNAPCKAAEVELKVELGRTTSLLGHAMIIKADSSRMQQVLVNLVSNAVRYGAQGNVRKVNVQVDVALPLSDGSMPRPPTLSPPRLAPGQSLQDGDRAFLFVSVSDTGPGMTPVEQSRLFSKFSQTGSPSTQTGLGLYIAKKLCDLQGGSIEVTSTPGGGSTFIACFEVRAVIPLPSSVGGGDIGRSASKPTRAQGVRVKKTLRILAVDDNIINRKILKRQLMQEGHDCSLANDGQHALDTIHANEKAGTRFECIVLDCNMPVLSGMECAKQLRLEEKQRGGTKPYWILGCTGQARPAQIQAAMDSGFNQVITKPYRIKSLLDALTPPAALTPGQDK